MARKPKRMAPSRPTQVQLRDCFETPAYAVEPLLPYLRPDWVIWEPACGSGQIVRVLAAHGWRVIASDLRDGRNFFAWEPTTFDCIVTNPPFSDKYRWLARCYALGRPWALLLPYETGAAAQAIRLFLRYGPTEDLIPDRRINYATPTRVARSQAQFPSAWFTWGLGIGRARTYVTLRRRPDAQLLLPLEESPLPPLPAPRPSAGLCPLPFMPVADDPARA